MAKKKFGEQCSPLTVLFKILANALLEDKRGINGTAFNALIVLAGVIDKELPEEIADKTVEFRHNRFRYEN